MVEIKLNDELSRYGVKGYVDPEQVEFINGLAFVKAVIIEKTPFDVQKEKTYNCWGLINERFEEAFQYDRDNFDNRYLMFKGYNRDGIRVEGDDFLIKVLSGDEDRAYNVWMHMRIDDGVPTKKDTFNELETTGIPHLISDGHRIYDVLQGKPVTRFYSSLVPRELDEDGRQYFSVRDRISVPKDSKGTEFRNDIEDRLQFVIDESGNVVSPIYSEQARRIITEPDEEVFYPELYLRRQEELRILASEGDVQKELASKVSKSSIPIKKQKNPQ